MAQLEYQNFKDARREDQRRFFQWIFGPSRKQAWSTLAAEIEARYVERGWPRFGKVIADVGSWQITLDIHQAGKHHFTRMRAPYISTDGFRFHIYRKSIFTALGKKLGMQDIEIGIDPAFDEAFVVRSNDPDHVRRLLESSRLRQLLDAQPHIHFMVKDDEGWFGQKFPEGVDELCFEVLGSITDIDRLHRLFELFVETLRQLVRVGSAEDFPPGLELK